MPLVLFNLEGAQHLGAINRFQAVRITLNGRVVFLLTPLRQVSDRADCGQTLYPQTNTTQLARGVPTHLTTAGL